MGALFVCGLLLPAPLPAIAGCAVPRVDARVQVARVNDGDTVTLTDGRRVRFIGLDTPEMNYGSGRPEPLAVRARDVVAELLGPSRSLLLQYGREREDRHGRLLAHPYLADGRSLAVLLLERGLAPALVYPPNLWNLACYQAAERRARSARRGVWALAPFRPRPAAEYRGRSGRYGVVEGAVTGVARNRGGVWLTLDGHATLQVPPEARPHFDGCRFEALVGWEVRARGRLSRRGEHWRMRLRHPAQLEAAAGSGGSPAQCPLPAAPGS